MTNGTTTFTELANAAGATRVCGEATLPILNVQYDSRLVGDGDLFVALRGGYADGHDFLGHARANGAVAALIERGRDPGPFTTWAEVEDTRRALSPLSARFFHYPADNLGVIGVTGTDGKTTTSYLIDAILRANDLRTGMMGTVAIRIGDRVIEHDTRQTTPESLQVQRMLGEMASDAVDWAVLEATSHGLAMHRLDDCPFDIAVVTNITREHLDFHGSVEEYRRAKARLLQRANQSRNRRYPSGVVLNADDEGAREVAHAAGDLPRVWFGLTSADARVRADSIESHQRGTRLRLRIDENQIEVDLRLLGAYNALNAMAAAGVGVLLGLSPSEIKRGLESLPHVPGRMQLIEAGQPFTVVVDYAHSPASLKETLTILRNITPGSLVTVFGSAGERDRGKRPIQGKISAELADFSIFTSEDPRFEDPDTIIREIADGAEAAGARREKNYLCVENRRRAIESAIEMAGPGDTVLLAGKGHEQCMIYGSQRVPWNEELEAKRALRSRGFHEDDPETEGFE